MSTFPPNGTAPRRRTALVVTTVVAVVALIVAAFLLLGRDGTGGTSGAGTTATTGTPGTTGTTAATATTATTATTGTTGTTGASPTSANAFAHLRAFFAAAARMDTQLRAAARKINAEGPPWVTLSEDAARAVRAADLSVVAETVPGGMPEPLLQSVMAVYHDLAARRAAMNAFSNAWAEDPMNDSPDSLISTEALLANLRNGVAPAARFDADVATAETRATSTEPFTRAALGSRADMETYLYLEMVVKDNFGCNSHGSPAPLTDLPEIVWTSASKGTIGGLDFEIRLEPGGAYTEDPILVC